jgi:hypothetical protein
MAEDLQSGLIKRTYLPYSYRNLLSASLGLKQGMF